TWLARALGPLERLTYRLGGVKPEEETGWRRYAVGVLLFNAAGLLVVYLLQRLQAVLPLNPQHLPAVVPHRAFDTAVSFATNTNWQSYSGEVTLGYLVQMAGLTVQNFVSAATGIAVLVALIRGLARRTAGTIGNFWVDLTRATLYVLLPLAIVVALGLVSQGVVQTLAPTRTATLVQPVQDAKGRIVREQHIAVGPAASQIAIKQLGTNGGGFYNVNSAHPLENATPFSDFLEVLSILLISAGLCFTFGQMIGDRRQGWAVFAAMTLLFLMFVIPCLVPEQAGNPRLAALGVDVHAGALQPGGNMEGKETRFGIASSAIWATATTSASNGSVNSMHDSSMPLGGLVPMLLMQLGEVVFGGVGSGLYGMLMFVIAAVFIAGLMVGRTPEYLGKKIEAFEMKMASLVILISPLTVKIGTAIAVSFAAGRAGVLNPGPHGFSEILYAFSSASNNNGSAFAGLTASTPFYGLALGFAMLIGRYWLAIPTLAIAGSLAAKKKAPAGAGTLPTHTPLFVLLVVATVLIVGALALFPALALGPVVEHLMAYGAH
ncbi:MAG TPA: potassium-transporting ATPase subunit KdpA, partial [Terriglobales bacterium]|nr:potassium-transporting ATPase subunit KdpA [Terriglobales bacterium]